jgi:2'-5' RNA ligase
MRCVEQRLRRLFVAVPVPDALLGFVRDAQAALPPLKGLRLLGPRQLHVTLAFIGEVGEAKSIAAREVVENIPADMGGTGQLGGFWLLPSSQRARVIALGVSDEDGAFSRLYEHVVGGLEARGVMRRERRLFRAHVSIARLRYPELVQPTFESARVPFAVESVCLYESTLRRKGAAYAVVARALLDGSRGQGTA